MSARTVGAMVSGNVAGVVVVVGVFAALGFTPAAMAVLGGVLIVVVAVLIWADRREKYWRRKAAEAAAEERRLWEVWEDDSGVF